MEAEFHLRVNLPVGVCNDLLKALNMITRYTQNKLRTIKKILQFKEIQHKNFNVSKQIIKTQIIHLDNYAYLFLNSY